eukprot:FR738853.1.p2 GENE.FR738853.1~~FR738853.1.p2  ORF type:complete len:163 (+),score=28.17 FR738853.1:528-1016(+)
MAKLRRVIGEGSSLLSTTRGPKETEWAMYTYWAGVVNQGRRGTDRSGPSLMALPILAQRALYQWLIPRPKHHQMFIWLPSGPPMGPPQNLRSAAHPLHPSNQDADLAAEVSAASAIPMSRGQIVFHGGGGGGVRAGAFKQTPFSLTKFSPKKKKKKKKRGRR